MDRLDCDRMFIAVFESGGFSRAAKRLSTSAGQASKLVTRLENESAFNCSTAPPARYRRPRSATPKSGSRA